MDTMAGVLQRGYQVHVMGFTLHAILAKLAPKAVVGEFDDALASCMPVIEADLLGEVREALLSPLSSLLSSPLHPSRSSCANLKRRPAREPRFR